MFFMLPLATFHQTSNMTNKEKNTDAHT